MDRIINYAGAVPLDTDLLSTNRNTMIALGKFMEAVLGTSTLVEGLICTPTTPASMTVNVSEGDIYSLQNVDGTSYGGLAADTAHQIIKQGLSMDTVNLACPAPTTAGYSINYLIQVAYTDTDAAPVTLPYYNASNPAMAYSGPGNSGTPQNTVRKGVCTVSVKAGTAATTGTQTTPAADTGHVGLYVVTVAQGQTTITAGNISQVAGAPFLNSTLLGLSPAFAVSPTAPTPASSDNTTKLVTSAWAKTGLSTSIVSGGYVRFPDWMGGFLLQWGTQTISAATTTTYNWPIAFPTDCFAIVGNVSVPFIGGAWQLGFAPVSSTQYKIQNSDSNNHGCWWIAIGI